MALSAKSRAFLRNYANTLEIRYQIGKGLLSDTAIKMFDNALTAHELIKIDIQKSVALAPKDLGAMLEEKLHGEVVSIIGRTILLYRRNDKNPIIKIKE